MPSRTSPVVHAKEQAEAAHCHLRTARQARPHRIPGGVQLRDHLFARGATVGHVPGGDGIEIAERRGRHFRGVRADGQRREREELRTGSLPLAVPSMDGRGCGVGSQGELQ